MLRVHSRFFSSTSKCHQTTDTFKTLANSLAKPEEIKAFQKNKFLKLKKSQNQNVSVLPKSLKNSLMIKEPLTFDKILEKSKILSNIQLDDNNEVHAKQFLEQAAEYLEQESKTNSIDWTSAMELVQESEITYVESEIDKTEVMNRPGVKPVHNIASFVNQSPTLQRLVDLGTNIGRWEQKGRLDLAYQLDFSRDVAPRIQMLIDLGISPHTLGHIFTENPELFDQALDDLEVRFNYLSWRKFTNKQICQIILKSDGKWLNHEVTDIDARLGFIQKIFGLGNKDVRNISSTCPQLVIWKGTPTQVEYNVMDLKHTMGFKHKEIKMIVKKAPNLFMEKDSEIIGDRFDVLHNEAGYDNEIIARLPKCLLGDCLSMKSRLKFLQKLGRDQFNPKKPNYVNPEVFANSSDEYFCNNVAKVPVELYNKFQQTM